MQAMDCSRCGFGFLSLTLVLLFVNALAGIANASKNECDGPRLGQLENSEQWPAALALALPCAEQLESVGKNPTWIDTLIALGWRLDVAQLQAILGDTVAADHSLFKAREWATLYSLDKTSFLVDPLGSINITRGFLLERRGDLQGAKHIYGQAPPTAYLAGRLGRVLIESKDMKGLGYIGEELARDGSALAFADLGVFAASSNDHEHAVYWFQKALDELRKKPYANEFTPIVYFDRLWILARAKEAGMNP